MEERLNANRVRLCALVWDLRELGLIAPNVADSLLARIEELTWREAAEFVATLLTLDRQKAAS